MQTNSKIKDKKINNSIISSFIKITRNIDKYPFVKFLTKEQRKALEDDFINSVKKYIEDDIQVINLKNISDVQKKIFYEKGIINENSTNKNTTLIRLPKNDIFIHLNDENHINIITSKSSLSFEDEYKKIENIENILSKDFTYLASTKYGFLTSKIKNCGLGLKISALVYLPGLFLNKKISKTIKLYSERGYYIKPWIYDNNENIQLGYYEVTSKINFGISEKELINGLNSGIETLVDKDKEALIEYFEYNKNKLIDKIYRSYGILKHAISIDYNEALEHITNIRIGLILDMAIDTSVEKINEIFIKIKEGFVKEFAEKNNISTELARAEIIKTHLEQGRKNV